MGVSGQGENSPLPRPSKPSLSNNDMREMWGSVPWAWRHLLGVVNVKSKGTKLYPAVATLSRVMSVKMHGRSAVSSWAGLSCLLRLL